MRIRSSFSSLFFVLFLLGTSTFAAEEKSENQGKGQGKELFMGFNLLHIAVYKAGVNRNDINMNMVKLLFKNFGALADEEVKNENSQINGFNVLGIAITLGHIEISRFFIENKPELMTQTIKGNRSGWNGFNLLHIAIYRGYKQLFELLNEKQPKLITEKIKGNHIYNKGIHIYNGYNTLHLAVHEGHLEIVKLLIKYKPKLAEELIGDRKEDQYRNLNIVQLALVQNHLEIAEFLIGSLPKELINQVVQNGTSSWMGFNIAHIAAYRGDKNIFKLCINNEELIKGVIVGSGLGYTGFNILHLLACEKDLDKDIHQWKMKMADTLIERYPELNTPIQHNQARPEHQKLYPLDIAKLYRNEEMANLLLKKTQSFQ